MSEFAFFALVFVGAVLASLSLTPVVRRVALAWRVLDLPGERKIHLKPVPRLGGVAVAVAAAVVVAVAAWPNPDLRAALLSGPAVGRWLVLCVAALAVVVMGAVDDIRGLSARLKFGVEIMAAAAVVALAGAPVAIDLSPFAGPVELGPLGPVVGVLWIVALTNAVNMTDVIDGVAAGLSAIAAVALALMSLALGNLVAACVLFALAGALCGFLPHNFRSRRIFLGDSGSLGIGFILGSASLVGLERNGAWLALPALLVLAVPLAECGLTVLRRTLRALGVRRADRPRERFVLHRGSPRLFTPDRRHIPHRLLELGLQQRTAVTVLYLVATALGALAFATVRWPWLGPVGASVALAGLAWFAPRWLYDELRVLERGAFLPLFESRIVHSRLIHALYDGAVVAAAYTVSEMLVQGAGAPAVDGTPLWFRAPAVVAATLLGFWLAGLYRGSYRRAGFSEVLRASRAVLFGTVLAAGVHAVGFGIPVEPAAWALYLYFVLTGAVAGRLAFRFLDHIHQRSRQGGRRALIFGTGRGGELALEEILSNPDLRLSPVGFVDDDPQMWYRQFQGYPVHEGGDRLEHQLRKLKVDELIISMQKVDETRLGYVADLCRSMGVRLVHFELRWEVVSGDGTEPVWRAATRPRAISTEVVE